ncbi:MAG TPA: hypothetical protein VN175_08650 [Rhizomicrobium sp.]|nr:hypothetical protein [Rhizomicrobium sp.]
MARSRNIQSRNRALLGVFGPPVLVFLLIVAGLYYYNEKYGTPSDAYDRAISDCVADRTRVASTTDAQERATSDCVRANTPGGGE